MADPFTAALVLGGISTVMKMKGQKDAHRAQQAQMERRKKELERNALAVEAVAQREGFEETRRAKLVASRAQALSAFSGAGATDSTVMEIIADIDGEGEYRRNLALYRGKEDARKLREDIVATQEAQDAERRAYRTNQLTSLFDFGSSAFGLKK